MPNSSFSAGTLCREPKSRWSLPHAAGLPPRSFRKTGSRRQLRPIQRRTARARTRAPSAWKARLPGRPRSPVAGPRPVGRRTARPGEQSRCATHGTHAPYAVRSRPSRCSARPQADAAHPRSAVPTPAARRGAFRPDRRHRPDRSISCTPVREGPAGSSAPNGAWSTNSCCRRWTRRFRSSGNGSTRGWSGRRGRGFACAVLGQDARDRSRRPDEGASVSRSRPLRQGTWCSAGSG